MAPKWDKYNSKQDYCTPKPFLIALKKLLNIEEFAIDLACSKENMVALAGFTEEEDSLSDACPWTLGMDMWCFCNPPFGKIRPWVKKAYEAAQQGARIALLVPANVGTNWWRDWVHDKAHVLILNGRLGFMPDKPKWLYPMDCAVLLYYPDCLGGYEVWNWRLDA